MPWGPLVTGTTPTRYYKRIKLGALSTCTINYAARSLAIRFKQHHNAPRY
jgi:hypothetical protein